MQYRLCFKFIAVVMCLCMIVFCCAVPAQAVGLTISGGLIASLCISIAASLGLSIAFDPDALSVGWQSFVSDLITAGHDVAELADKWTATYNNGILSMSDSMYNAVYQFIADYNNYALTLAPSSYLSSIQFNNDSPYQVMEFDSLNHAESYIECHKSSFRSLSRSTGYAFSCSGANHTNYLLNSGVLSFSQSERYSLGVANFPYRDGYTDASGFFAFTIGKIVYVYLYSVNSPYGGATRTYSAMISSKDFPQLVPFLQGKESAIVSSLPSSVTGGVTADASVFIPVHTDALNGVSIGDDVSAGQLTTLTDAVYNPAHLGTADGALVQADSAVNDITASMDSSIGAQAEYGMPGLKDIFPFCIPFDLYDIFRNLQVTREAPNITVHFDNKLVPFVSDDWSYDMTVDLSDFDSAAAVLRTMELIGFVIALALASRKLIGA